MFNESQQRYLISRLRHVEEILSRGVDELDANPSDAIFSQTRPDATASQRRVLRDYLAQLRFTIRRFMLSQSLKDSTEPISGLWSFHTTLSFALISLQEMEPQFLRGYGELDPKDATVAEQFVVEAQTLLRRIGRYLADGTGGDLAARIAQLDATREEIGLLGELEKVISRRGLVELRTTLQTLVERANSPRFEIAIFGRVNAGKSSLLNWWLDSPLLPTGITPVTAVPTRITYGSPAADVTFADGRTVRITLEELSTYITETGNPGNARGVLEVSIRTQSQRLREGMALVDTPGVGSLASAGAVQTLQYLPRCDLGVVLLEAGAPIAEEDLDVTRALLVSGADVLVVLSKADRLAEQDLRDALTYTEQQLRDRLDPRLAVAAISTVQPNAALASAWFEECVEPRLTHLRDEAARFLRRKISALRESVVVALEARLRASTRTAEPEGQTADVAAWSSEVAQARSRLDRMRRDIPALGAEVRTHVEALLTSGAQALAQCWDERQDLKSTNETVRSAMAQRGRLVGELVVRAFQELRSQLESIVGEELPKPQGVPVGEFSWPDRDVAFRRPRGMPAFEAVWKSGAKRRVRRELESVVADQLRLYGQMLQHWARRYLDELGARFEAIVTSREGLDRVRSTPLGPTDEVQQMVQELQRLRNWAKGVTETHTESAST